MSRYLSIPILVLWIVSITAGGCGSQTEKPSDAGEALRAADVKKSASEESQLSATDGLGRPVKLKGIPKRIITIGPAATETVFALGAGASLIGRDEGSDYPPAKFPNGVKGLAVVGDYRGPDAEKAVAVRPDMVIIQGETFDKHRADTWQRQIGSPVAVLRGETIREAVQDMMRIGLWLKRGEQARAIVTPIMDQLNLVRLQMAPGPGPGGMMSPLAFFEVSREPQLWSAGKGTRVDDLLTSSGFTNAAAGINGYKAINFEQILARNPTCYIAMDFRRDREKTLKELKTDATISKLQCVREGRIFLMNPDEVMRPGPRLAKGMRALAAYAMELRRSGGKLKSFKG